MSRPIRPIQSLRCFSTSRPACAPPAPPPRRKVDRVVDIKHVSTLKPFEFNDTPWLGYMKMLDAKENLELVEKVTAHADALKAHRTPFTPPSKPIRVSQFVDMVHPHSHINNRCVLLIPVSSLPLSPAGVQRCKLIAGQRWSPGQPGRSEMTPEGEGWIKISSDKFDTRATNRKAASDMLDRLIEASNSSTSPIPEDAPVDIRHLIARRKRQPGRLTHTQSEALKGRKTVGGWRGYARGFPADWVN